MNSTQVWFFSLAAYFDTGPFRPWIFVVAMFGYGSILCSNVLLILSRFDMSGVPIAARIFLSLYWLTSPPLFNPVMYGLNVTKIRILCKGLIAVRLRTRPPVRTDGLLPLVGGGGLNWDLEQTITW
ncbi:uncharacterized protein V6R79_015480 [Siganus canaliculatus]